MAVPFEIYAHQEGNAEKYSFRESDLKDGIMGPKRRRVGTLYAPGELGEKFVLVPHTGKILTNVTDSLPLKLADLKHEAGEKRAWTADEAVAKARGPEQGKDPIFIFVQATP